MALITCEDCKKEINSKALTCIYCGGSMQNTEMTVHEIIKELSSGLTGESNKDIAYLIAQSDKYKTHELAQEILIGIGILLYDVTPPENQEKLRHLINELNINIDTAPLYNFIKNAEFFFVALPALWDSQGGRQTFINQYELNGGKSCMSYIFNIIGDIILPKEEKNEDIYDVGDGENDDDDYYYSIKLVTEYFNNENYNKLYVMKDVPINLYYKILEIELFDSQNQDMINKVEKVWLVCNKDFSIGCVYTLELGGFNNSYCICEASVDFHSNHGSVNKVNAYDKLTDIILRIDN